MKLVFLSQAYSQTMIRRIIQHMTQRLISEWKRCQHGSSAGKHGGRTRCRQERGFIVTSQCVTFTISSLHAVEHFGQTLLPLS